MNDRLSLNARLSGTIENNEYINYGDGISSTNVIYQALQRNPGDPVYNEDGGFFETDRAFNYNNPVAIIEQIQNEREAKRFLGNFQAGLDVTDKINVGVNLAYIRDDAENFYFEPSFAFSNRTQGLGRRSYENKQTQLIETTIRYVDTYSEKHSLSLIGGHSYQKDLADGFSVEGTNAQSHFLAERSMILTSDFFSLPRCAEMVHPNLETTMNGELSPLPLLLGT